MTHRTRPTLSLISTLAFLAAGILFATSAAPVIRTATVQGKEHEEDDTKLGGIMEHLRGDMKRLGKEIEAKDAAAAWKSVCSVQQHILDAKQESPESAKSKSDAERPAFVNAFHAKISELLRASCELEAAILANKFDDAAKTHREMFGPMQKAGHKQFRND